MNRLRNILHSRSTTMAVAASLVALGLRMATDLLADLRDEHDELAAAIATMRAQRDVTDVLLGKNGADWEQLDTDTRADGFEFVDHP